MPASIVFVLSACGGGGSNAPDLAHDPGAADVGMDAEPAAERPVADSRDASGPDDAAISGDAPIEDEGGFPDLAELDAVLDAEVGPVPCDVPAPLSGFGPVEVEGGFEGPGQGGLETFLLDAVVSDRRFVPEFGDHGAVRVQFRAVDSGASIGITASLPLEYEIPVAVGQRVKMFGARRTLFYGRDLALIVWDSGFAATLDPVFFLYDSAQPGDPPWHQCGGVHPCPSARMLPADCAPQEGPCGSWVHPPVELLAHGGETMGETPKPMDQGTTRVGFEGYRYMAVRSDRYTEMLCMDVPDTWLTALIGKSRATSQCVCLEDADCANGFFCDPTTSRCIEDLCRPDALAQGGKTCKEGYACDPYRGECVNPATGSVQSCVTDEDCSAVPDHVCNPRGRLCSGLNQCNQPASFCVQNPCVVMDCAPPCHSLLGRCTQCVADCDCDRSAAGDFCEDFACGVCDRSKIGFGQENPMQFEFYEVCVRQNGVDPVTALKQVDPSVTCIPGGSGVFAKCDTATEVLCHGDLEFLPGLKWITDRKWGQLCRIAGFDWVTKMAGGHFLE